MLNGKTERKWRRDGVANAKYTELRAKNSLQKRRNTLTKHYTILLKEREILFILLNRPFFGACARLKQETRKVNWDERVR